MEPLEGFREAKKQQKKDRKITGNPVLKKTNSCNFPDFFCLFRGADCDEGDGGDGHFLGDG